MQLVELYQSMYASGYKKRVLVNNITTLDNNTWTKLPYSFQPFSFRTAGVNIRPHEHHVLCNTIQQLDLTYKVLTSPQHRQGALCVW